jgi:regulator of RNase E activity RraA
MSNAIERLDIRPRNEGFITGAVTCRFPQLPPVIGYAVTARMRSSMMPIKSRCYYEYPDLWCYVASLPGPRILVTQDADDSPGVGALLGEAYARISRALGCVACVTNGAVRDLPGIEALGFQVFAGSISVSHADAHVMEFGEPVEIGGTTTSFARKWTSASWM